MNLKPSVIAVAEEYFVGKGINQGYAIGYVVSVAVFELLEEKFNLVKGQDRTDYLLPRKLRFKVGVFGLTLTNL